MSGGKNQKNMKNNCFAQHFCQLSWQYAAKDAFIFSFSHLYSFIKKKQTENTMPK